MTTENPVPVDNEPQGEVTADQTDTAPRLYSQEQVNQMMGKLRSDERKKTQEQSRDVQFLKERARRADELEQAQMTETEKLATQLADYQRKAVDADMRIAHALISSEVKVKAAQMGVIDPEAADVLLDRSGIHYSEEGGVVGVDDALSKLLDDKPYLKGVPTVPNLNAEMGQPAPTLRLTTDQREAARLMGISEEEYAQGL